MTSRFEFDEYTKVYERKRANLVKSKEEVRTLHDGEGRVWCDKMEAYYQRRIDALDLAYMERLQHEKQLAKED